MPRAMVMANLQTRRLNGQAGLEGHRLINAFAGVLNKYPAGYTALLQAFCLLRNRQQVVIVDGCELRNAGSIEKAFYPHLSICLLLTTGTIFLGGYEAKDGRAAYVCQIMPVRPQTELAKCAMVQQ